MARRLGVVRDDNEQTFATLRRIPDEEPCYLRERMLISLPVDWFDFEGKGSNSLSRSSKV